MPGAFAAPAAERNASSSKWSLKPLLLPPHCIMFMVQLRSKLSLKGRYPVTEIRTSSKSFLLPV
jgi:hypothetical protein